ncbi:MAG TPA: primosomal protein N' [Dehalococcoidia bacterium]|nr:primosomal protein N' [Dehalococcoidia bacterium]
MPYAEVAVNAAAPIRQTFTYRVPDGLNVAVGQAVYVPFGARTLQGIVCEVTEEPRYQDARDIEDIIDERPLLSPERVALALWLSGYYLAPLFDCVSLMLPPGFKRKPQTLVRPAFWAGDATHDLTDAERAVLDALQDRPEAELEELKRSLKSVRGAARAIGALTKLGVLARSYRLARPAVQAKTVSQLTLRIPEDDARARADALRADGSAKALKRAVFLDALAEEGALPLSRARAIGLTPATLRDFEAEAIATVEDVSVVRDPLAGRVYAPKPPADLTPDQQAAASEIIAALDSGAHRSFLLHGVTGSGKTEVYLAAIDHAASLGKRAVALVPEISLTPQTVRRFGERFPGEVAVMHSELSLGEHFDMWHTVRDGNYRVVIGPRGALFAPQPDLGLVIIDEEHEWTYKQQEGSPRYHARKAAEELCRRTGAVLVLGSATPDVESHFRASAKAHRLLELPQRLIRQDGAIVPAPLPEVEIVDLREELKAGNRSIFSRSLSRSIRAALDSREQVMLFLNRRGSASFVQCRDCGYVPECKSCAVALTYHDTVDRLVCHYCHRRYSLPATCPECGGKRLRQVGIGTERVEEAARNEFPGARTLRWDRDVTRGRDQHEAILAKFLAHEADILVGTQMIAKGLDIPLVTLVGVISADIALHLPDFRAGERTFQLLEQVAGRAGRGEKGGRVVVQTYTPDHFAIEAMARHDYHAIYTAEIENRQRMGYPPFGRLVRLTYAHTGADYAQRQAFEMTSRLRAEAARLGLPNVDVLGPSPAYVSRIRGRWRWNVLIRGDDPAALLGDEPLPRGWTVDVDPISVI